MEVVGGGGGGGGSEPHNKAVCLHARPFPHTGVPPPCDCQ